MNQDAWLSALTDELRRHGVDAGVTRHVVAEAASHLRDSGEPADSAFGAPAGYARAVVESVGRTRRPAGDVRLRATDIWKREQVAAVLGGTVRVAAIVGTNRSGVSARCR